MVGGPTEPPGIDAAWELALEKLEAQRNVLQQLDTKAAALFGVLGLAIAGYVGSARTTLERVGGGVLLAGSILAVLYAFLMKGYADAPNPNAFTRDADMLPVEMRVLYISAVLQAYHRNAQRIISKERLLFLAFTLMGGLGIIVIIVIAFGLDPRVK